jgi:hypothetical protein
MNQREIKIGKKYRHFKGNEYLVLHLAKHSAPIPVGMKPQLIPSIRSFSICKTNPVNKAIRPINNMTINIRLSWEIF